MVFCSLVVFVLGGDQLPSAPPLPRIFFGSQEKTAGKEICIMKISARPSKKAGCGNFTSEPAWWVSALLRLGLMERKPFLGRMSRRCFWVGGCFSIHQSMALNVRKQNLDSKSSKMMRLNFARTNMIKTSTSKLWMLAFCLVSWVFQDEKNKQTKSSSVFKCLTRVIWANYGNQTAGWGYPKWWWL